MNLTRVKEILATSTLRQSSLTFSATIVNGALGALFYIFVARSVSIAEFGIFTLAITVLTFVSDIGDLGTDTGLVNFVGRNIKSNPERAKSFIHLGLLIKTIVGVLVFGIGYIVAPFVANTIFTKPEMVGALRLAFLGVGSTLFFSLAVRVFQGMERFWHWSALYVGTNLLRLVLALLFVRFASTNFLLAVYILVPLIGLFFAAHWFPSGIVKSVITKPTIKEFFHYNKWVAAFICIAALSSRMDTFLSAKLLSAAEVGLYGAATQAVTVLPQLVAAIGTVVAPKMASLSGRREFVMYFKKTQFMVLAISAFLVLAIPVGWLIIPALYGQLYSLALPAFTLLALSGLIFLVSVPVHMGIIYYYQYPKLFVLVSLGHLTIVSLVAAMLVPTLGINGAAVASLAGSVFNLALPATWLFRKVSMQR